MRRRTLIAADALPPVLARPSLAQDPSRVLRSVPEERRCDAPAAPAARAPAARAAA